MSQCNFRTFTIILVLELVAFETQVEGFTIQRSAIEVPSEADQTRPERDSVPAGSANLEVRNDLKNNVKPIELKTDSPPLTVPIQTTAKTEEIHKNEVKSMETKVLPDTDTTLTSASVMTTEYKEPKITSSETSNPSITPTLSYSVSSYSTPDITTQVLEKSVSTTKATNEDESNEYLSKDESTLPAHWGASENVQEITTDIITTTMENKDKNVNEVNAEKLNTTNKVNVTDAIKTTEKVNTTKAVNITQKVNTTSTNLMNGTNQLNSSNSIKGTDEKVSQNVSSDNKGNIIKNMTTWLNLVDNNTMTKVLKLKTGENNTTGYSTEAVKVNETAVDKIVNNSNDGIQDMKNTKNSLSTTTVSPKSESTEKQTEQTDVTEENISSTKEMTGDYSGVTGVPYWKKYTTIERKRVNTIKDSETSTEKDQDLLQSGTAQTQTTISLEKALNIISDIPSLEQLKNDLLALNKMSSTTENTESTISLETGGTPKSTEADSFSDSPTTAQGSSVISSKRAGYLDFSSRPMNGTQTTKSKEAANVTEIPWNYSNPIRPSTTPRSLPEPKSMTSQSQLVEDAINEELMKEEVLFDNVENAKRVQGERFGARTKPTVNITPAYPTTGMRADSSSSEDKLRVRPISAEKLKNGSLYSPNPNYKPLKKIEVQPPKPFVRNPDDNSWRNESLSSLGIVFKANNSSKPFTQVLKNKTETEFNALLDRYNKGDAPELRTRLEKITEMRKTKKKKVNALGETVYTDYEENSASAENSNSSNSGSFEYNRNSNKISSFLDQAEVNKPTTSTRGYNFDEVELTTKKAQKLLDDYDDDDEEEYTLPNIDLKKYFTPTSAPALLPAMSVGPLTSPPLPLPVRTFPPDRRPTVQYFPPREKPQTQQKVVLNDYDTGFQQKVNAYTYNSPPKVTNPVRQPQPPPPSTEVTFNFPKNKFEQQNRVNEIVKRPQQMDRNIYLTQPAQDPRNNGIGNPPQDVAGYNQASYVIKHLRDFIDEVVKSDDTPVATEESVRGVTVNNAVQDPKVPKDYYDYETQFRKDVINRFVENFNQNSERFKADFPILYNTSVVHSPGLPGSGGAESTAFMKRLYDDVQAFNHQKEVPRRYDPNCDRTVELSPAYELHYYVPEEEEKEVVELKPIIPPHRFRL